MKKVTVKVRATDDAADGIDFEVDGVKAKHASLKLDKDGGDHRIRFELRDETKRGLRFDTGDPIWVDEDAPCPPQPGINSDQIVVCSVEDRSLVAINSNSGRARALRYQLNFVASDGAPAACDPIIENGGGVKPPGGGI